MYVIVQFEVSNMVERITPHNVAILAHNPAGRPSWDYYNNTMTLV